MVDDDRFNLLQGQINNLRSKVPPNYGNCALKVLGLYGNNIKTFIGQPYEKVFVYDSKLKYWIELKREIIYRDIQQIANTTHINKSYKESVYSYLKDSNIVLDENNSINPYHIDGQLHFNGKFRVENGIFDTHKLEFYEGNFPNAFIIYKLNMTYDESVSIEPIKSYITSLVGEKFEPTIREMLGKCLAGNHKVKKLFVFQGDPDSGKSKLLLIIKELFGAENCSNLTLEDLSDPFTITSLARKIINAAPEIKGMISIKDKGIIKSATGEDIMEKRIMRSQDTLKVYSIATNIFSINETPYLSERISDKGFFVRFQFIPFIHIFNSDKDTNIVEKMTTPNMRSAWFNYMIDGLKRLKANNWKLTNEQSANDVIEIFNRKKVLTTMEKFSIKCCNSNIKNFILGKDLFKLYVEFMNEEKEIALDYGHFVSNFNKECIHIHKLSSKVIDGTQERVFLGIESIKGEFDENDENLES